MLTCLYFFQFLLAGVSNFVRIQQWPSAVDAFCLKHCGALLEAVQIKVLWIDRVRCVNDTNP